MSDNMDYKIIDGVLVDYNGDYKNVTIPDGVHTLMEGVIKWILK